MPLVRASPFTFPFAGTNFSKVFRTSRKGEYLMAHRFLISQDSPSLFITIVTKDRLPVFRSAQMKELLCNAIDDARRSAGLLLFAYVIMTDHLHLLTNRPSTTSN